MAPCHRLREDLVSGDNPFTDPVEVDETCIGGKRSDMANSRHKALEDNGQRGAVSKTAVVGMRNRKTNEVRVNIVDNTNIDTLQGFVKDNADNSATVLTDGAVVHNGLPFDHESVNRLIREYVKGMTHTNDIESFRALLKRGYYGTCRKISRKRLYRYVGEFAGGIAS